MDDIELRLVKEQDALLLFPLIFRSPVTDTLLWDGPEFFEEYQQGLAERARRTLRGESHMFTIFERASQQPVGSIDIRPHENYVRGDIGLWIGKPYHGKGYGTQAVRRVLAYGFGPLGMQKIESEVFLGNWASRRIFEKNGFRLEGTRRCSVLKRGRILDEWNLGITRDDYFSETGVVDWIVHLCPEAEWAAACEAGHYRAPSLEREGFIHFSRPSQMLQVANAFYAGCSDLVLLWVQPALLQAELRWEQVGDQVFPHLYGEINLESVVTVRAFPVDSQGTFQFLPYP
jgi:uncharacterized protein (DUF952 family)/RimJ/RimL family protein N-acetyltransferase